MKLCSLTFLFVYHTWMVNDDISNPNPKYAQIIYSFVGPSKTHFMQMIGQIPPRQNFLIHLMIKYNHINYYKISLDFLVYKKF